MASEFEAKIYREQVEKLLDGCCKFTLAFPGPDGRLTPVLGNVGGARKTPVAILLDDRKANGEAFEGEDVVLTRDLARIWCEP